MSSEEWLKILLACDEGTWSSNGRYLYCPISSNRPFYSSSFIQISCFQKPFLVFISNMPSKRIQINSVEQGRKVLELVAIQIIVKYLDFFAGTDDSEQRLGQLAFSARKIISNILSHQHYYLSHVDRVDKLLESHKCQNPKLEKAVTLLEPSASERHQQASSFLKAQNYPQERSLLQFLYNLQFTDYYQYVQNAKKIIDANPRIASRAILQSQIYSYIWNYGLDIVLYLAWKIKDESLRLDPLLTAELFCQAGRMYLKSKNYDFALKRYQDSLAYNRKNIKAHKAILQLLLERYCFKNCIDHIENHRKALAHTRYFLAIEALAYFLHENSALGLKLLHSIKAEIDADPDKEREYWYFNYCWGYLKCCMLEYEEAYQHFQKELKMDSKDVNVVRMMATISFRLQDYKRAEQLIDQICRISHSKTNTHSNIIQAYICSLNTKEFDKYEITKDGVNRFIQYTCYQSTPLYFGFLYSLGEYEEAIQKYEDLPQCQLTFFSEVQLKMVMLLCYQKTGDKDKILGILGQIRGLIAGNADDSILYRSQLYQHLQFLVNFCFQHNVQKEGRFFAGRMRQNMAQMIKALRMQDDTKIREPLEVPQKVDIATLLFRAAYE